MIKRTKYMHVKFRNLKKLVNSVELAKLTKQRNPIVHICDFVVSESVFWSKIRIHVGEIWGFPERLWFFKHALVHQQINEILRIDTQNIIIISQQFYNNKPEFLFLLSPSSIFFNWFVGLKYTEPSSPVIYKNAP